MPLFASWELNTAARRAGVTEREFVEDAFPHASDNEIDNQLMLAVGGMLSAPLAAAIQRQLQKQA